MKSIRAWLTLRLCLAIGLLLLGAGAGVYFGMSGWLEARFDDTLGAKARALITASEIDDGEFEIDLTVRDFAGFGPGGSDYFEIRRASGGRIASSPSLRGPTGDFLAFPDLAPPPPGAVRMADGRLADGRAARFYLEWVYPKDDDEQRFQDIYLIAASPTDAMRGQIHTLAVWLGASGVVALLVLIPLVRMGLARGLHPLHALSARIESIRPDELDARIDAAPLPAELQPLASSLNAWLGRLEASFERERRFSAHAAHELRTPLAEIRSIAELGARWPEEATPGRCEEILTVCDELEALLHKLSLLARVDAERMPVAVERCALEPLVATTLARFAGAAAERRIRIDSRVSGDFVVTDPALWGAIFQNLVGNAVSHAPEGSAVTVEVLPEKILVANPAPELAEKDLPHLVERFWTKHRTHGQGHSGLGLALVQACAERLGGAFSCRLRDGSLQVEVSWGRG
jgi:signal transduction histidine kinase